MATSTIRESKERHWLSYDDKDESNEFRYSFHYDRPETKEALPDGGERQIRESRSEYIFVSAEIVDAHYALLWGYMITSGKVGGCKEGLGHTTIDNFFGINDLGESSDAKRKLRLKLAELVRSYSESKIDVSAGLEEL